MARCQKPHKGALTAQDARLFHKIEMVQRRKRQLARVPDNDYRVVHNFSKSSLPEYRKPYVRDHDRGTKKPV